MKKRQERSKSGYLKGTPELDALADMMEREKEIREERARKQSWETDSKQLKNFLKSLPYFLGFIGATAIGLQNDGGFWGFTFVISGLFLLFKAFNERMFF